MKKRSIKRFLRYIYLKLLRIQDTPEKIALSFSVGVFIGIFPTFGLGGIIMILICYLFKLNYIAGILGTFIMNYFTSPFFWALSYMLGDFITTGEIKWRGFERAGAKIFILRYLLGNLIISILCSILSYFVVKNIIITYRKRKRKVKPSSS